MPPRCCDRMFSARRLGRVSNTLRWKILMSVSQFSCRFSSDSLVRPLKVDRSSSRMRLRERSSHSRLGMPAKAP
eukprot:2773596-Rhodomonas_salina.1